MLYRDIMSVYSEIHTKHRNTLRGWRVEFLNAKPSGLQRIEWPICFKMLNKRNKFHYLHQILKYSILHKLHMF